MSSSPFAIPPPPPTARIADGHPGAVDARPTDAVWKDNKLAFVSTYPVRSRRWRGRDARLRSGERAQRRRLRQSPPTFSQDFLIAEDAPDLYMGGMGYALNDDLHVVWTRSFDGPGHYPSSYARLPGRGGGERRSATGPAQDGRHERQLGLRWGDYVGVAQDPQVPNAVWQGNQYAVAGGPLFRTGPPRSPSSRPAARPYVPDHARPRPRHAARFGIGLTGPFAANTPRIFQVPAARHPGRRHRRHRQPDGHQPDGRRLRVGHPDGGRNPPSSTINFPVGDNRANNVTVPLQPTASSPPSTRRRRQDDPPDLRRHRLLPGRRRRSRRTSRSTRPGPRQPVGHRAWSACSSPDSRRPVIAGTNASRPTRSRSPAT